MEQACFLQTLGHCLLCEVELSKQQWVSPQFHPWESRPVAEARQALRRRGKLLHDLRRRPRTATPFMNLLLSERCTDGLGDSQPRASTQQSSPNTFAPQRETNLWEFPSPPSTRAVAHEASLRLRLVENWKSKLAHLMEYGWDPGTSASGWRSVASAR